MRETERDEEREGGERVTQPNSERVREKDQEMGGGEREREREERGGRERGGG